MITDHYPVNRQMLGEVYDLIEIFPYFQSAHLLLLKGLQDCADVKFENQLRNSAIHIADREVLYYLLNTKTLPVVEQIEPTTEKPVPYDIDFETQQIVIESATNSEQLISEIEHNSEVSSPGDLLELDLEETTPDLTEDITKNIGQFNNSATVSKKQLQSELIEKFIITNPRIEPNKEKSSLPVEDISKSFVEGKGGFFTETLARIYVNQGYYSKAIDIYEKLSLKFPEKSSYFASQIEKVKEFLKK